MIPIYKLGNIVLTFKKLVFYKYDADLSLSLSDSSSRI